MDRLTVLLAQYVQARDNFSRSGGALIVDGSYKRTQFLDMTTDMSNQLAQILPIGNDLDLWTALEELVGVRLGTMRGARERP